MLIRPLRLVQLGLMSAPAACLIAACSEQISVTSSSGTSSSSSSTEATSSASASASSASASAASGSGSGAGGAGGSMGHAPPPMCFGNHDTWVKLTEGPIPCLVNSDCCLITNECLSSAQVVGKDQKEAAATAWPYCDHDCNDCTAPAVEVACVAGMCLGRLLMGQPANSPDTKDHCGSDTPSLGGKGPKKNHFVCGG